MLARTLKGVLLASLACVAFLHADSVAAHEIRPAGLLITEVSPGRFEALWKQPARGPLVLHLIPQVSNGLLDATPDEMYATDQYLIKRWNARDLSRESFDGATVRIEGLQHTLNDALVLIELSNGQQIEKILRPQEPQFEIHLHGRSGVAVPAYLALGIEHILTGFDHLSFVLGLILLVNGRGRLVKTITAFTLAHSITLAAAALGYVHVSAPAIEALVALSIAFVAVEVVRSWRGQRGITAQQPWLIAFTFGLLHGFAFAGSLAQIGLPPHNIPGALFLFNVGVEIGQLLFVGAVLLCAFVCRRFATMFRYNALRWLAPYSIGVLACYWMFERIAMLAQ